MSILSTLAQSGLYDDSANYYTTTTTTSSADAAAALVVLFLFAFISFAVIYAVTAIFLMRIFKKAGQPGWPAWVPLYNNWKMLEIGGQQGFWAILAIIPIVNIVSAVFMIIAMYNIGLKLGKEGIFVLLAVFLPIVWLIWLAVDKSVWDDSKGAPSLAGNAPQGPMAAQAYAPQADQQQTYTQPAAAPPYTPPTEPTAPQGGQPYTPPQAPTDPNNTPSADQNNNTPPSGTFNQ